MNATKWVSLNEFVKHLGREGIAHVEEIDNEGEHGWYLSWIDNSPSALARQDALQKMERAKMDGEGRDRKFLKDQIERAQKLSMENQGVEAEEMRVKAEEGLKKDADYNPVKITFSFGGAAKVAEKVVDSAEATTRAAPTASAPVPFKMSSNPFKLKSSGTVKEATKFGGAFKNAASSTAPNALSPAPAHSTRPSSMTAAEQIMAEEQERKDKRKLMGPQPSAKRMRM
jgi:DNA/RNA-binding protein KIN17